MCGAVVQASARDVVPHTGRKAAVGGPPYLGHPYEVAAACGPSRPRGCGAHRGRRPARPSARFECSVLGPLLGAQSQPELLSRNGQFTVSRTDRHLKKPDRMSFRCLLPRKVPVNRAEEGRRPACTTRWVVSVLEHGSTSSGRTVERINRREPIREGLICGARTTHDHHPRHHQPSI